MILDLDEYTEEYNTSGAEIRRVATSRARVINNRRGGCIDDFKRHPNLQTFFLMIIIGSALKRKMHLMNMKSGSS